MLAEETPIEETKISLYKQQQYPRRQGMALFSTNKQGISAVGKGGDLGCCIAKILLECR